MHKLGYARLAETRQLPAFNGDEDIVRVTLLDRLKSETRAAHDKIEETVDLFASTSSVSAYRHLLARFYGFHAVWEAEANAIIADPALLKGRSRTPLLCDDLLQLGLSENDIAELPVCEPVLARPCRSWALGAMYVVEGSTIGGNLIAKHVERNLGFKAGRGCSYFRSYGADVVGMWQSFRSYLLAASSPTVDDHVVAGANQTFRHLGAWLSSGRTA